MENDILDYSLLSKKILKIKKWNKDECIAFILSSKLKIILKKELMSLEEYSILNNITVKDILKQMKLSELKGYCVKIIEYNFN